MNFLQKYSGATHTIAVAVVSLIGAYYLVPDFKAFIDQVAALIPNTPFGHLLKGAIVAGVALILHYRQNNSGSGPGPTIAGASKAGLLLLLCLGLVAVPLGVTGCSASDVDTVISDLPIAVDIATSVVAIVDPSAAGAIESSGKAAAGIKLVEKLVQDFKANPSGNLADQINAALQDVQQNLSAILNEVGVKNPSVTAAVAAAVGSVKLILNDVAILVKNHAPPAVTARLFFGVGMPGVNFLAIVPTDQDAKQVASGSSAAQVKASGKSARQIAQEYNQKVSKDFPRAKVNVPGKRILKVKVPLTGGK